MLEAIGIFLIMFGAFGSFQNLRLLAAFRNVNKMSANDVQGKEAFTEHFLGLLIFSAAIFGFGIFLIVR